MRAPPAAPWLRYHLLAVAAVLPLVAAAVALGAGAVALVHATYSLQQFLSTSLERPAQTALLGAKVSAVVTVTMLTAAFPLLLVATALLVADFLLWATH